MTLDSIIDGLETSRKTVTVFAPEPVDDLVDFLRDRNVEVVHERVTNPDSDAFVVVTQNGEYLGSVDAAALAPWAEHDHAGRLADVYERERRRQEFRRFVELLGDTVFASSDRRQLLLASREFEDRAWRVGNGRMLVSFQEFSRFRPQVETYETLGTVDDLDLHLFGYPDWKPPDVPGVSLHAVDADELRRFWVVTYDGGSSPRNACALIAREGEDGRYRGFWTYDGETVAELMGYLAETYLGE